ncbi:MAG: MoaD/ThiS family protein [Promethearchaeota archaeon]
MPKVKFLFFSSLQEITQSKTIDVDIKETVKDALDKIFEIYGDNFKNRVFDQKNGDIKRYIIVAVNRKDIRYIGGLNTKLNDGDEISLLPAAAGG